jgi:type I restriction enzyme R subunit
VTPVLLEAGLEHLALEDLTSLGWATAYGPDIAPGEPAAERGDYREVLLTRRLRSAVARLNLGLPAEAIEDVVKTVLRPESAVAESENWRAYDLLVNGVSVDYRHPDGTLKSARARLVDFDHPASNDLLAVNQFTVRGRSDRRPDVMLFVNGLPLVLMELKGPGKEYATLRGAYNQIQTYRDQIPDAFTWNQLVVISDGVQARVGSFTASAEHVMAWKTIDGRELAPSGWLQIEVLVRGLLAPAVLLDLVRNDVAAYGEGELMAKLVAKYHQYWAVRKAVDATVEAVEGDGRRASSGTPRAPARAWRCSSTPARSCGIRRWRTRRSSCSPTATTSTTSSTTRSSRRRRPARRCRSRRCRPTPAST